MEQAGKKATLYEQQPNGMVKCTACTRYCRIGEGAYGFCGVRKNVKGHLELEVYGRPCSVAVDPVEKKPFFHFLPGTRIMSMGTFGCNFACEFCQNWDTSQYPKLVGGEKETIAGRRIKLEQELHGIYTISPEEFAKAAVENGCKSEAFTYNEPTIFAEYAHDCAVAAKKKGLKTAFVSNGYESKETIEYMKPVLDAINIDLKGFTEKFYKDVCHSSLEPVLETIKRCHKEKIWTEITTLAVPGQNDSKKELEEIAQFLASVSKDMPWHVTAFHPDYKMDGIPSTPASKLVEAREIGFDAGLKFVYAGNLPIKYSEMESTYCPKCKELLVERHGYTVGKNIIKGGKCPACNEKISGVWD